MTLILFVCRGNTCRSPMAEAVARTRAGIVGVDAIFKSAGIAVSVIGAPADPRAIACAAKMGLDLTAHRADATTMPLLSAMDRIYALDREVRDQLMAQTPQPRQSRIHLLMSLVPETGLTDVADPWSGTAADYDGAFALIDAAVAALIDDLKTAAHD